MCVQKRITYFQNESSDVIHNHIADRKKLANIAPAVGT